MTTLEQGLYSFLSTYAGLKDIISGRVYLMMRPQSIEYPCLTYQRISTDRQLTHDTSGASGILAHPRIQFDAWSYSYAGAKSITDALRGALNGKTGSIGVTPNNITIRAALVDSEVPEYEPESNLYRSRSEYFIWHEE